MSEFSSRVAKLLSIIHIMKLAIIFVVLAVLPCHHSNAQATNKPAEIFSRARRGAVEVKHIPLSIDYGFGHVLMSEQSTVYSVQLPIGSKSSSEKHEPLDPGSLNLQVWLLKTDGTAIPKHGKPGEVEIGSMGWDNYYMMYTFDKGSSNELAGIVVRAKEKLYVQEIGTAGK
jgi:hypothetical protein